MFELNQHKTQALYFQPSYARLEERICKAAPDLDIALIDEEGQVTFKGKPISAKSLHPDYFWIHSEMFASPFLKEYFRMMLEYHEVKWLHTVSTGLDMGPYRELLNHNIRITNNHSQAIAIAEFVMGQVLSWFQNLPDYAQSQKLRNWKYRPFREIHQSRWLIIGFGHIGQQIARRAKAFGVHITAVRRSRDDAGLADTVCTLETMESELQAADVVVLACTSNDGTRDLVDKTFLSNMKAESVLINIARGDLVVEEDLRNALDAEGSLAHVILDVFRQEPLTEDAWFWNHPAVTMTPHCSNGGSGMRQRSDDLFIENLYRISNGQLLLNEVSEKYFV
jgi:phosphoglycerate dehydrogenase-like enzyme